MLKTAPLTLPSQLQETIGPLSYTSETEAPFQAVQFRAAEREAFGVVQLLREIGLLQSQNWEQFFSQIAGLGRGTSQMMQSYQNLRQTLHHHLPEVQFYLVGQRHPSDDGWEDRGTVVFPLILGQTQTGDWVGLCPKFRADATASDDRIRPTADRAVVKDSQPIQIDTLKQIAQLKAATAKGVLMLQAYNSCEWVSEFFWKAAANPESVIADLLISTGFLKIFPFQGFSNCLTDGYRPELLTPEEKAFYAQFTTLDRLLRSELTDIQEYIIGGYTNFHLYVVGKTADGDWAGVATQAVWT
jgi:Nuclease A inhibitor-like protein